MSCYGLPNSMRGRWGWGLLLGTGLRGDFPRPPALLGNVRASRRISERAPSAGNPSCTSAGSPNPISFYDPLMFLPPQTPPVITKQENGSCATPISETTVAVCGSSTSCVSVSALHKVRLPSEQEKITTVLTRARCVVPFRRLCTPRFGAGWPAARGGGVPRSGAPRRGWARVRACVRAV